MGVTTLNGLIYAVGGSDGSGEETRLKSAEKFDVHNNVWIQMPNMREQRSDAGNHVKVFFRETISGYTRKITYCCVT